MIVCPPKKTVYLAGPITGLTHDEARNSWRKEVAEELLDHIYPLSPMRAKEFLANSGVLVGDHKGMGAYEVTASPSGIVTRDHNDVKTCDAMLAVFPADYGRVSIGTAIEFGWANAYRKPIVMVAEEDDIHRHAMLVEIAGYVTTDLSEGVAIINHILTPGV